MGVNIDVVDTEAIYHRIVHFAGTDKLHKVMYVNAHCMVISQRDATYRKILNRADFVYSDGMGVVWGARLLGLTLPGRSTAADFMPKFFKRFVEAGFRLYFLGGKPGVALAASERLKKKYGELQVVGYHHGYFSLSEQDKIVEKINKTKPHLLLVGMGVPYQEKWMEQCSSRLDVPVVWGLGAVFDYLAGELPRGPQWLMDSGFEWLCRLVAEPKRLWRRYLIGNVIFLAHVFRWKQLYEQRRL
jgi:N-acetylglucosaminyldiphosphoundecaprenol N-acetyl-beta-D-mannosaminyltransferase